MRTITSATYLCNHIEQNDPKSHVNENYRCLWSSLMVARCPGSLYSPNTHITSPKIVADHYDHTTDHAVHTSTPRAEMRPGVSQMVCAAIHTSYRTRLLVQHLQMHTQGASMDSSMEYGRLMPVPFLTHFILNSRHAPFAHMSAVVMLEHEPADHAHTPARLHSILPCLCPQARRGEAP